VVNADRNEIEALARKVHAATNVPLFSPKSYLELFRMLAEEVAENGYHFQATAENVAAKLTAAGRNATRRQIVFIVKGLALKGHVFSNTDTPERLAEVFREQVLYLIRNSGLDLTPREFAILPAWIVGRPTQAAVAPEISVEIPAPTPPPKQAVETAPPRPPVEKVAPPPTKPEDQAARTAAAAKKKPGKPLSLAKSEPANLPPRPIPGGSKPSEASKQPAPGRISIPSRPSGLGPLKTPFPPAKTLSGAPAGQAKPGTSGGIRPMPPPKSISSRPSGDKAATDKPAAVKPPAEKSGQSDKEAVESTILAAIAQAVDVLVEDSSENKPDNGEATTKPDADAPAELPPPDSDDIGDEIQRIIATYNRDRQQSD
jgi:hypothetical protein